LFKSKITLQDLHGNEQQVELFVTNITEELEKNPFGKGLPFPLFFLFQY